MQSIYEKEHLPVSIYRLLIISLFNYNLRPLNPEPLKEQ